MATFREKLSNWFKTSQSDEQDYYDDEPQIAVETATYTPTTQENNRILPQADNLNFTQAVGQPADARESIIESEVTIPYWLEDEDTLRDEGVLFGLSESDPTEKTDIIHKYFSHLTAGHQGNIEQQNERIQEMNLFIGQKTERMEFLNEKLHKNNPENSDSDGDHQLPRTLIGLALSIAMCVGNFYLIRESLKPAFTEASWIALGVFLAGMFSLFGRISLFHDTESKISWRSLLEEIGMPFASALFVFANSLPYQTWWQAFALFIFVFFLFLFAGKLFLSNTTVLRNDLKIWTGFHKNRQYILENTENCESELLGLQQQIDELRIKKWQLLREQSNSETERDRLFARRDMLIKLFESEFFLARRMKNQLTNKQLNYIQGNK